MADKNGWVARERKRLREEKARLVDAYNKALRQQLTCCTRK